MTILVQMGIREADIMKIRAMDNIMEALTVPMKSEGVEATDEVVLLEHLGDHAEHEGPGGALRVGQVLRQHPERCLNCSMITWVLPALTKLMMLIIACLLSFPPPAPILTLCRVVISSFS